MDPVDQTVQDSASRGSWAAIAALVVWALIALAKSDKTPLWLTPPPAWRPLVAVLLGQVYAVLEAGVHGMPWGAAVVRGFVVAAAAIAGQELGSKLTSPPAPTAPKDSSAPSSAAPPPTGDMRVALAWAACLATLALLCSGCSAFTPAQNATLAAEVPKIAGAGCQVAQSFTDSGLVKFLCRIVEGGGLANMSTGPAGLDARPQRAVEIEVLVPKDQADAFAKAHPQR